MSDTDSVVVYAKSRHDPVLSWLCDTRGRVVVKKLHSKLTAPSYVLPNGSKVFAMHVSKHAHKGPFCTKPVHPPVYLENLANIIAASRSSREEENKTNEKKQTTTSNLGVMLGLGILGGVIIGTATQHKRLRSYFTRSLASSK